MTQLAWEKSVSEKEKVETKLKRRRGHERMKFLIGGLLILGAVSYLIFSSTISGARYFILVDDVVNNPEYVGKTVRLTGVVLGETIDYDAVTGTLEFTIAHLPAEYEDLGQALHEAASNRDATRLLIHMDDTQMPDLLQHEAQAILTGTLREDGIFYGTELNLKCPTRFQEFVPESG